MQDEKALIALPLYDSSSIENCIIVRFYLPITINAARSVLDTKKIKIKTALIAMLSACLLEF